eukprot:1808947-Prymnesium_polylepis.1
MSCGQLYCGTCGQNIGSGKQPCDDHTKSDKHLANLETAKARGKNTEALKVALDEYKGVVKEKHGEDAKVNGLAKDTQE